MRFSNYGLAAVLVSRKLPVCIGMRRIIGTRTAYDIRVPEHELGIFLDCRRLPLSVGMRRPAIDARSADYEFDGHLNCQHRPLKPSRVYRSDRSDLFNIRYH